jgi:hypothetical protein
MLAKAGDAGMAIPEILSALDAKGHVVPGDRRLRDAAIRAIVWRAKSKGLAAFKKNKQGKVRWYATAHNEEASAA